MRVDDDGVYYDEHGNAIPDPTWISEEEYLMHEALTDGDRGAALELWRRVADGKRTEGLRGFVQEVARRLIEADRYKQDRRRGDIVAAVGLKGAMSPAAARRRRIAQLPGLTAREIWKTLAAEGLYRPAPSGRTNEPVPETIEKAVTRVRRARKTLHEKMIEGLEDLSKS